jgi:hypothetical protein
MFVRACLGLWWEANFTAFLSFQGSGVNNAFKGFQGRMAQLAQSQAMGVYWAVIILTNSVYLGVQLEWTATHRDDKSITHIFAAVHVAPVMRHLPLLIFSVSSGL